MLQFIESEVRNTLEPFHARLSEIVRESFAEAREVSALRVSKGFGPSRYPRTVANDVFDAISRRAINNFRDEPNVQVIIEAQTVKFIFGQKVIARFKKGDENYLGRNIPTQAVLDFVDPQQTLPGFPPAAAKVDFVWTPNEIGTEIERLQVVARNHDVRLWSYDIGNYEVDSGTVRLQPESQPDDQAPPLVYIKNKANQSEKA